jgi:acetylornithine deacetylase/succinyl-diaminopimelate desuccinylase-like protein
VKHKFLSPLILLTAAAQLIAQPPSVTAARAYRQSHEQKIIGEFSELLAVPNVASDAPNIRRNAELIARMLGQRGVKTRLLEAAGAPPVVYGEIVTPGATRTLIFYAHYDGQPVEPEKWTSGEPFRPALYTAALEAGGRKITPRPDQPYDPEWRLYARSSSDDKAPVMAIVTALDALKAGGVGLSVNVKFFFEGEEEAGSPHLAEIVAKHGELLKGDVWIICDGPVDQSRRQQLFFGVRGVAGLDITVYGPRRELHSGHYGNWAPNPAMMLARLLASMKDDDGRVLVEGFYEGVEPLGEAEKRALAEAPDNDAALRRELGLARTEGGGKKLIELINLPSLNVRGVESASVGATGRNVIPSSATASIDIRLVKGIDHRRAVDRVVEHVRRQGYHVVEGEPDEAARLTHPKLARVVRRGGYNAARTPMDLAVSRAVIRAVEEARGPVVKMPTLGGSVPLYVFADILKAPVIGVPIANHDNNQHSAHENIRLQNLWDGIEVMAALLAMK